MKRPKIKLFSSFFLSVFLKFSFFSEKNQTRSSVSNEPVLRHTHDSIGDTITRPTRPQFSHKAQILSRTPNTYAMSRNVNFWLAQKLIFVSTAYLGPIEPISIVTQIKSGGRFQSSPKMLIFLNFFGPK